MISAGKGSIPKQHPSQPQVDIMQLAQSAPPPVNPFTGRPGASPQSRSMLAQSMLSKQQPYQQQQY